MRRSRILPPHSPRLTITITDYAVTTFRDRTLINLRMKGNSIFWKEENAEAMLTLRGLVLSGRWKPTFAKITESMACDRRLQWEWRSPDMPAQLKANDPITPPQTQSPTSQASYNPAA